MARKSEDKISILIEARNESGNLEQCIRSAQLLTKTVVLVDQYSEDDSALIAKKLGATIIQHNPITVVEEIREFGIKAVKTPWVFILDADERMTADLAKEIQSKISNPTLQFSSYQIPRKNIFMKRWLKHGGWYPDAQTRLIHIPSFHAWPPTIHAEPVISGARGLLSSSIEHYAHGTLETMVEKTALYENKESDLLYAAHKTSSTPIFFRKFFGELFRRLFKNQGFRDGVPGVIESFYQAYSKTITYLMLYEKQQ